MTRCLLLLATLLLAACGETQQAAYLIGGAQHSLTLSRQQDFMGADWTTELVVARFPDCQRRYLLLGLDDDKLKMDLYQTEPGVFILNSGKRWYVTETQGCRFQQFKVPPPAPGELIGRFEAGDVALEYKALAGKKPAAADAAQSAPGPTARQ